MTRNRATEKTFGVRFIENRANPLPVDQVPTLIPEKAMNELTAGDPDPYFRIQSIEFPAEGDNPVGMKPAIYGKEFFASFVEVMNSRPIPGSKRGHEFKSRPNSDFYTVGGKVVENGDRGVAHFKVYIPPEGDETSNRGFIRDNRAGIVEFSIEAAVEYSVNQETQEVRILKTRGGERNEAVPQGAMAQTVNSDGDEEDVVENAEGDKLLGASVKKARQMINAGEYDANKKWSYNASVKRRMLGGNNWKQYKSWHLVEHGSAEEETQARYGYPYGDGRVVLKSALRSAAARASQQNLPNVSSAASRLIDLINEKENTKNQRRGLMDTKEEVLEFLRVNKGIPIDEVANAMGQEARIATDEHANALKVVNALKEMGIEDPVKEITALREEVAKGESDRIANRLTAEFGPEQTQDGKVNALRRYAGTQITNAKDLDKQIESLREDPVAKQLSGQKADFTSNENKIGVVEKQGEAVDPNAPIVAEY